MLNTELLHPPTRPSGIRYSLVNVNYEEIWPINKSHQNTTELSNVSMKPIVGVR